MNKTFNVVIPSRFASTRFPGKPLIDLAGKSMIQRVYERACKSEAKQVIVATDDSRIANIAKDFGAPVCMTSDTHQSGTDRLQEVCQKMGWGDDEIIVNVQGDEPLIPPENINQVAQNLANNTHCDMASLVEVIHDTQQVFNPNCVKAVMDNNGAALYFSRAPIPWDRNAFGNGTHDTLSLESLTTTYYRHIGIYAYKAALLNDFVKWPEAELERIEGLEQLRVLANGRYIHLAEALTETPPGIDSPEDVQAVLDAFKSISGFEGKQG